MGGKLNQGRRNAPIYAAAAQELCKMTPPIPTIHIVDDDASFRASVGELLSASGYKIVFYESALHLLQTPPINEPACILLDVQMADLSGPELQGRLAELNCKLPVVFLTGHGDIQTSVQTIKAGAEDFLTKPVPKEKLIGAIERSLLRYEKVRKQDNRDAALQSQYSRLTRREKDVFALLVRGKPHKQIAFELCISERTIKLHRHSVMEKLQVRSLAELAINAERLGLVPGP